MGSHILDYILLKEFQYFLSFFDTFRRQNMLKISKVAFSGFSCSWGRGGVEGKAETVPKALKLGIPSNLIILACTLHLQLDPFTKPG